MDCWDYYLKVCADGVPIITSPKHDAGCRGDVRRFTVLTDLPNIQSYAWRIDNGPILSTKPYFDYTYDNQYHTLKAEVHAPNCGLGQTIPLRGKQCTYCPMSCRVQSVDFPAGELTSLFDINGKEYPIEKEVLTVCKKAANSTGEAAVKKAIRSQSNCENRGIRAYIFYTQNVRNCLTLTIYNSPIKFNALKVGTTKYFFDISNC